MTDMPVHKTRTIAVIHHLTVVTLHYHIACVAFCSPLFLEGDYHQPPSGIFHNLSTAGKFPSANSLSCKLILCRISLTAPTLTGTAGHAVAGHAGYMMQAMYFFLTSHQRDPVLLLETFRVSLNVSNQSRCFHKGIQSIAEVK